NPLYSYIISLSRASLYIIFSVGKYTDIPPNSLNKAFILSIPSSLAIFSNCGGKSLIFKSIKISSLVYILIDFYILLNLSYLQYHYFLNKFSLNLLALALDSLLFTLIF